MKPRDVGRIGEDAAAEFYSEHGYSIAGRNWRCKHGELDVIAIIGSTVVFCEVKCRTGDMFGSPAEAVTPAKQARLRILAAAWLESNRQRFETVRFDVASVRKKWGWAPEVEILENAF